MRRAPDFKVFRGNQPANKVWWEWSAQYYTRPGSLPQGSPANYPQGQDARGHQTLGRPSRDLPLVHVKPFKTYLCLGHWARRQTHEGILTRNTTIYFRYLIPELKEQMKPHIVKVVSKNSRVTTSLNNNKNPKSAEVPRFDNPMPGPTIGRNIHALFIVLVVHQVLRTNMVMPLPEERG